MIGVSSDSIVSHCKFAEDEELPFPILSDDGEKVRHLYEVPRSLFGLLPGRVTYVIDRTRRVRHVYKSQLRFRRHARRAKDAVQALHRDRATPASARRAM